MLSTLAWFLSMLGHYTSTYCIHDEHDDCRLTCKVCKKPCRCRCHKDPIHTTERQTV